METFGYILQFAPRSAQCGCAIQERVDADLYDQACEIGAEEDENL